MKKLFMIVAFSALPLIAHTDKAQKARQQANAALGLLASNSPKKSHSQTPPSTKPTLKTTAIPPQKPTAKSSNKPTLTLPRPATPPEKESPKPAAVPKLYLADEAKKHITDMVTFEKKITAIANSLEIPSAWVMALIHSESNFNPKKKNAKGSGAKGLIQIMPIIYKDLGISSVPSSPFKQLDYAKRYLLDKREQYGKFNNLTDLKLAVLYPGAIGKPNWHVLFQKPSRAYLQNSGLDLNKDGKVSVGDVKNKMKKSYGKVYWAKR